MTGASEIAAAAVAHKLKSSARSVGALKLAELCVLIECAGRSGDLTTCTVLMPQFEAELTAVRSYLQQHRSAGGAAGYTNVLASEAG